MVASQVTEASRGYADVEHVEGVMHERLPLPG